MLYKAYQFFRSTFTSQLIFGCSQKNLVLFLFLCPKPKGKRVHFILESAYIQFLTHITFWSPQQVDLYKVGSVHTYADNASPLLKPFS